MKNFAGSNFSLFYFFILFIISPLAVYSYDNSIIYNETEIGFKIDKILTFRDRTSVIRLVKPINDSCVEPRINLRILHPNGTIDKAEVDYPIPAFNFCHGFDENYYILDIERSFPESLYILYVNSTDIASASYYVLIVNRMGKFVSNTYIAPASKIVGSGYLQAHISEEYGFIFTSYENETIISWKYFSKPDDKGKFNLINEGKSYQQSPLVDYSFIAMIDGSFGLVITNRVNKTEFINPSEFMVKIYLSFIKPTMNAVNGPFLIYQSTISHSKANINCDAVYTGTVP